MVNARPLDSSLPILDRLGLLTLENKRLLRSLVLFYKIINGQGPKQLTDELTRYLRPVAPEVTTRLNHGSGYWIPSYNTEYRGKSFFVSIIKEWNRLPNDIKSSTAADSFKRKLYLMLTTSTTISH